MKMRTKLFIGRGLVAGTGLTVYGVKKYKDSKAPYVVDEMLLVNHDDALTVLKQLKETVDKYDFVTVVDYYDMLGVASSYAANGFGWNTKTISTAKIKKVRGGYMLKMPRVEAYK